jgi:hypothetical protein
MIILNSTITFSMTILPFLYLLSVIMVFVIFFMINTFFYDKFDRITKYKEYSIGYLSKRSINIIMLFGVIVVPLFKNTIKDARQFLVTTHNINNLHGQAMHLNDDAVEDVYKRINLQERTLKLLNLKYKKENFVNRKVFSIFVEQ